MSYIDWGYRGNPFETTPLPASKMGQKLFVGRENEARNIKRRLDNGSKLVTVEGLNGVGKTSAVNVSVYNSFRECITSGVGPLYIPCRKIFQLSESDDAASLKRRVLLEVAQTLFERHGELPPRPGRTRPENKTSLDRYINSPIIDTKSGGLSVLSSGLHYNHDRSINDGQGFEDSGLEKQITDWLEELFPTSTSGGVVCILDNMELLQTSQAAQDVLERLRDTLFSIRGIRWVLCGALGIMQGVVASPRLDGRLHKPILIEDLASNHASKVFRKRVNVFREGRHSKLPMTEANFIEIFDVMNGNLRSALSESDDYCNWVFDRCDSPENFDDELFEEWLEEELNNAYLAVKSELKPAALKVFETACQFEVFSPSDCNAFGYSKPSAMRPQIKRLEGVGLLQSALEETDKRRKSIQVTAKGWKVRAYLDYYSEGE